MDHILKIVAPSIVNGLSHTIETKVFLDEKEIEVSEIELISIGGKVGDYWKATIVFPVVKLETELTAFTEVEGAPSFRKDSQSSNDSESTGVSEEIPVPSDSA